LILELLEISFKDSLLNQKLDDESLEEKQVEGVSEEIAKLITNSFLKY